MTENQSAAASREAAEWLKSLNLQSKTINWLVGFLESIVEDPYIFCNDSEIPPLDISKERVSLIKAAAIESLSVDGRYQLFGFLNRILRLN